MVGWLFDLTKRQVAVVCTVAKKAGLVPVLRLMRLVGAALGCFALGLSATPAAGAGVHCRDVPRLQFDAPMRFCLRTNIYISAVGRITSATPADFLAFLREVDRSRLARPHSVTFHSPGGSIVGALALGRMIRTARLDTHVGQSSECASACFLAFIGGWSRKVTHDGRIGNHQIRNSVSEVDRVETVQDLIHLLSDYHREMQVSPLAVTAAMSKRSSEMYWYSPIERREWGIVTIR